MKGGNLVYCLECFNVVHLNMSSVHRAVNIFIPPVAATSTTTATTAEATETEAKPDEEPSLKVNEETPNKDKEAEEAPAVTSELPVEGADSGEQTVLAPSDQTPTAEEPVTESTPPDVPSPQADTPSETTAGAVETQASSVNQPLLVAPFKENATRLVSGALVELRNLSERCEQLGDVKQSIRQMNDLIKEDIFTDLGIVIMLMRDKLEQLSDHIKERLKDAYSVVRDAQARIHARLVDTQQLAADLHRRLRHDDDSDNSDEILLATRVALVLQRVGELNDEMRELSLSSTAASALAARQQHNSNGATSLPFDANLLPQFSYAIETRPLVALIEALSIQIGPSNVAAPSELVCATAATLVPGANRLYDCVIASGLDSADGTFWLQLIAPLTCPPPPPEPTPTQPTAAAAAAGAGTAPTTQPSLADMDAIQFKREQQRVNALIDEISKHVRGKRICEPTWRTLAEKQQQHRASVGDKCFALEPTSRKWMRAQIVKVEEADRGSVKYQVRLLDTGVLSAHSFDAASLIEWRELDDELGGPVQPIGLRCVLFNGKSTTPSGDTHAADYETNYTYDARFFFRDNTSRRHMRCVLLGEATLAAGAGGKAWKALLYYPGDERLVAATATVSASATASDEAKQPPPTPSTDVNNNKVQWSTTAKSVNKLVLDFNEEQRACPSRSANPFSTVDIRLANANSGIKSQTIMVKTGGAGAGAVSTANEKVDEKPREEENGGQDEDDDDDDEIEEIIDHEDGRPPVLEDEQMARSSRSDAHSHQHQRTDTSHNSSSIATEPHHDTSTTSSTTNTRPCPPAPQTATTFRLEGIYPPFTIEKHFQN